MLLLLPPHRGDFCRLGAASRVDDKRNAALARRHVSQMADDAHERTGLTITTAITEGEPEHVLVSEADRWGEDCIVLGARGHGKLERFLLGTVASGVAARAHCSVEVVSERSPHTLARAAERGQRRRP